MGLIPSEVAQQQFDCYGPNGVDDMCWFRNSTGIVSWIDCNGFGRGNLAASSGAPIVQNSLLAIDTDAPQSVVNNNILTSLYQLGIYMESRGDGAPDTTCVVTISWTGAAGGPRTVTLVLDGDTNNIQMENYVILALAGTDITVSSAFTSTAFHYDLALAISLIPLVIS